MVMSYLCWRVLQVGHCSEQIKNEERWKEGNREKEGGRRGRRRRRRRRGVCVCVCQVEVYIVNVVKKY